MASRDAEKVYEGLARVAHAIRRSAALYVAMQVLPPESTFEHLKDQAEDFARWIGGLAQEKAEEPVDKPPPLGEQWPPQG